MAGYYKDVYAIVCRIPRGRVSTYGRIAAMTPVPRAPAALDGRCTRLVRRRRATCPGGASSTLPDASATSITPKLQRALLEAEGIVFDERGYVDLKRYLWNENPS